MDKAKVSGVKWFVGEIDGKKIDTGTVYLDEKLDDRRGTAKGRACTPYKVSSAVAMTLAKRDFPIECEIEFERMSDGKGGGESVIVDIRPVDRVAPTLAKAS